MLLSFVVPCFNVREFLPACLKTLNEACLSIDAEVVMVNDGSTDSTLLELERWHEKFEENRFRIIDKENGGLSSARNTGISEAKGEYIFLLDSDDYIDVENLKVLCDEITKNKPDAIFFKYYWLAGPDWYWETGELSLPEKTIIRDKSLMFSSLYQDKQFYSWSKVFKKEFYACVSFPDGRNYEDIATVPKLLEKVKDLYYLPVPVVFYRQRQNSIMKTKNIKNALDLSSSALDLPDFSASNHTGLYLTELKVYIFLWSMGDLSATGKRNNELNRFYVKMEENFYNSVGKKDVKELVTWLVGRKNYRMALKSWLLYHYPRLVWKVIRTKRK